MLSDIWKNHKKGIDHREAIARGVASTGRDIARYIYRAPTISTCADYCIWSILLLALEAVEKLIESCPVYFL